MQNQNEIDYFKCLASNVRYFTLYIYTQRNDFLPLFTND